MKSLPQRMGRPARGKQRNKAFSRQRSAVSPACFTAKGAEDAKEQESAGFIHSSISIAPFASFAVSFFG